MGSITKIKSFRHVCNSDPADDYKIQPENVKKPKNKHGKLLAIHVSFKQLAVQNIEYIMTHTGDLQCGSITPNTPRNHCRQSSPLENRGRQPKTNSFKFLK